MENQSPDFSNYDEAMRFRGWVILSERIPMELVLKLRQELYQAVKNCETIRKMNGHGDDASNTAHHLLGQGESFAELLTQFPGLPYIQHLLGERMVLNSFAGTLSPPQASGYAHRVHRDIRFYTQSPLLMLNTLILLEDFTAENGGTFLMTGSHLLIDKPSDVFFTKYADQVVAKAGSILIFNSNIWHAAGINKSTADRPAVSMTFSSPEIQQQYNFSQFVDAIENGKYSQLLGGNTKVPNTLEKAYKRRLQS